MNNIQIRQGLLSSLILLCSHNSIAQVDIPISGDGNGRWSVSAEFKRTELCCSFYAGDPIFLLESNSVILPEGVTGRINVTVTGETSSPPQNYRCTFDGLGVDLTENFHEIPLTGCRVPDNNNPSVGNYEFTTNATATLTAKLTNIASTQKSIKIKDISIMHLDKNHHHDDRFLLNGEITLPPASRCSISAPATLTLPDVGASSLGSAPPGNGAGASVAVPVTLECTPASTATLTLNTPKADNGCIGTDLPGYAICVDDVDLSTGGAKLGGIQNGVKELWLRGGRGSGKVTPGVGTGTLTVTATPS